jgi:hypothetical protein
VKRRTLFGRLAAVAAAVAVAPAVKTEAATAHGPACLCETPGCLGSTLEGRESIERMAMEQAGCRAFEIAPNAVVPVYGEIVAVSGGSLGSRTTSVTSEPLDLSEFSVTQVSVGEDVVFQKPGLVPPLTFEAMQASGVTKNAQYVSDGARIAEYREALRLHA